MSAEKTILLIGAAGQVGRELRRELSPGHHVIAHDRGSLDLMQLGDVRRVVREIAPAVIVNAAAYTQVDRAESEPAAAFRINAEAPAVLAEEARRLGSLMIHYSTDYVFGGTSSIPYREEDVTAPASVYGKSKLAGDEAVVASGADAYIFRVSWVYGLRGRNFLLTMQRLAAERDELRVVADQLGSPTWSRAIAQGTMQVIDQLLVARATTTGRYPRGLYHMAGPDHTSWHGFAAAIVDAMSRRGRVPIVTENRTDEQPTAARRPAWSVLDSGRLWREFGVRLPPWRQQLESCLAATR